MHKTFLIIPLWMATMACSLLAPASSAAPADVSTTAPAPDESADQTQVIFPSTLLYISGTTHIETNRQTWPDVDAFLTFLQQVTDLGMRWSVGADIGWLEGEPRAAEAIQRSEAMGVQWDIHTHNLRDRAKAAYLITQMGGHPTTVYSGFLIHELETFLPAATHRGFAWAPQVLWGAVSCPGHRPGCDEQSAGIWRPKNPTNYLNHDANGNVIHVGGGTHQLEDARRLAQAIANGEYQYPIISFTVMIAPVSLQIVQSNDGIESLTAFADEMNMYPFIRWATIAETAQAWVESGSIPSRIEMK